MGSIVGIVAGRTVVAALAFAALWTERADGAAWNRAAGSGLVIFDVTRGTGTDYFDGAGSLARTRAYAKEELAAYVQYGLTDDLMLVARPSLDRVSLGAPGPGRYDTVGRTDVAAQWRAWAFGPAVLAIQGGFSLPGANLPRGPAFAGDRGSAAELRVLGGVSLPLPLEPFVDVQGAYRIRSGGGASLWLADATFGLRPTERLLLLAESHEREASGRPEAAARRRSTEVWLKAVYALTPSWWVQVGGFTTATGRDALRERGLTTGLWHTF